MPRSPPRSCASLFIPRPRAAGFGGLARASRCLGPHALDLAARQGHTDLSDPIQLDADDRLGVEALQVDQRGRFAALDRLQIAFSGFEANHRFLTIEARERMPLLAIDHDDVAALI